MKEKAKKVFISGKITGDSDYKEKFAKAEKELSAQGYLVMNPGVFPEGFSWFEYMTITLSMLEVCNAIYMLDGWQDSRGANLEYLQAQHKGYTILYQTPPNCPEREQECTK